MRTKKGILKAAAIVAMAGLGLWSLGETTAQAVGVDSTAYDGKPKYSNAAALAAAPQGVDLTSPDYSTYFTINTSISGTSVKNSAVVKGPSDGVGSPSNKGNSVIQISSSGTKNSWGSIWSAEESFDLSKPETASMWVFLSGPMYGDVGDGMAFVLQNEGTSAFSGTTTTGKTGSLLPQKTTVDVPGVGESMGVWGMDPSEYTSHDLAGSAIQNSWALEFDTHDNSYIPPTTPLLSITPNWDLDSNYSPSSFDAGQYFNSFNKDGDPTGTAGTIGADNHIASNYPGSTATYTTKSELGMKTTWNQMSIPIWGSYSTSYYYYKMTHLGYLDEGTTKADDSMTNFRWHHITLNYTPPTDEDANGEMTYTFNDKDPSTGAPQASSESRTVPIKLSEFNLTSDKKVRWGFTGSTGEATANNLVIFDQIPGEAESSATATLSQKGDGGSYSTVDSNTGALSGGTPVKLEYDFKRTGGLKDWKDINAELSIPSSISLTSGTVTTPSGDSDVDLSKLDGTKLPVALGSDGNGLTLSGSQGGKITLYGTIKNADASEASTTSYFQGSNATSAAKLTSFSTKKSVLSMDIDKDKSTLQVNSGGDDAKVIGVAVPDADSKISAADITIHPSLSNGEPLDSFKLDDEKYFNPDYGSTGFTYPVANDKLSKGSNTISFYATDTAGDRSPVVSTEITAGFIQLGAASGDLSYGSSELTGGNRILNRDNDWSLSVDNSLISGTDWELDAQTTGMFRDGTPTEPRLDGSLIYTDSQGATSQLNSTPVKIASGSSDGTTKSTNIAENWSDDTGIRLKVNSGATEGKYSGEIQWTFKNAPE